LETGDGEAFFAKWNRSAAPEMFEAEADGLAALREAGASAGLRVPEVIATGAGTAGEPPWLLLEFVERGRATRGYGERLGRGVAAIHRFNAPARQAYGWSRDNYIGSLPQSNPPSGSWPAFWRDARLAPQMEIARSRGFLGGDGGRALDALLGRTAEALAGADVEGSSLLHGDLWSGNVYPGPAGEPVLIDPAVYHGHREVDLAMSELFGGFPGFFAAYDEVWPLSPDYARVRRPLYQLYYLLVHVNLFGGSYADSCVRAARSVLSEL
jgi:fructosamine-3-kinase